ncbi:MAG: low-specificity L-threonine aldolase [Anaerolineales bacterium]
MDVIDLRSDTVTHPTPEMRRAMAEADVGDDVYGEDPTVNELQRRAAQQFGKAAALLVSSGSMGNVVSLMAHCGRGERVIMGQQSHTNLYEAGNPATLGGIQAWTVPVQPDGTLSLADIRGGIPAYPDDAHFPLARAVSLENTQGSLGGQPIPANYIDEVGALCRQHDLALHIDGARIFNAAAALDTDVATLTASADSVTFCLSKGLCAPVGSIIVGSEDFIMRAHRVRKALGGGMRQAGIIAAAGIIALEEMSARLAQDHATARMLAAGLNDLPEFTIDLPRVRTNMFFCDYAPDARLGLPELADKLRADNIWLQPNQYGFRAVTHYWITEARVEFVLQRIKYHLS